jgi:mono/diheme cytochrome c family protein
MPPGVRALALLCAFWLAGLPRPVSAQGSGDYQKLVGQYCATCHNDRQKAAGLSLQGVDPARPAADPATWEKVIRKVANGAMPPAGAPRPEQASLDGMVRWLATSLDQRAAARPNPGRPVLHRLNRAEYANAVRDLIALEIDAATLLPPDPISHGFDNMADALDVSPALLERYLAAADRISALAIGDPQIAAGSETYTTRADSHQLDHVEGLPLGTRGGLIIKRHFPLDAEYVISARLYRSNNDFTRGLVSPHELEFTVDGERVFANTVGGPEDWGSVLANPANSERIDQRLQVRIPVKAGARTIGVTFLAKTGARNPLLLKPLRAPVDTVDVDGIPRIDSVSIKGPFDPTGPGDTASRRRIFVCRPATAAAERPCARRIVATIARRAIRGPVSPETLAHLLKYFDEGRARRGNFDGGVQLALRRILSDPAFLFRAERDPRPVVVNAAYRVGDLELASRLSFFLWSSIPDDELLGLAEQGRLSAPAVYAAQVRRMLADPRAEALVANFTGQWLQLRNLQRSSPDLMEFPEFDDGLRQGFRRETELLFASLLRENRSALDLLQADYTFVNERLARHYGMAGVTGSHFRRVAVAEDARCGLLGHGSMLLVTSHPNRTSPVKRGKWVLETLLGTPPPPPPANVPPLDDGKSGGRPLTMKERMEEHRRNPACANCHKLMDPIGLALENFDGIGGWRTREAGSRIDAGTQLSDGTAVNGVVELRRAILRRPDAFVRTVTENLLTYALGRELSADDMPAVRTVMRRAAPGQYRLADLIEAVTVSTPFTMRVKAVEAAARVAARVP